MQKTILFRTKFILPNSKHRDFYESPDGYLKYMKTKEKDFQDFEKVNIENKSKSYLSYFDYMTRRKGSAGYFHIDGKNELKPIPKDSNIWDIVVSLETDFALENGMVTEANWKKVLIPSFKKLLSNEGFDYDNVQAIASFHSNTANPHVHIRMNELNPKKNEEYRIKGKLLKRNMDDFKVFFRDKIKNVTINWGPIATAKTQSRLILQDNLEDKLIKRNSIVNEVKRIINSRENKRASFNSLNKEQKNQINIEYSKFIDSFPELKLRLLKAQGSFHEEKERYLRQSSDFGESTNIFDKKMEEINVSLKNIFIRNILKTSSSKETTTKDRFYLRKRKEIIAKQKRKRNFKHSISIINEMDSLLIQEEREIIEWSRGR